MRKPQGTPEMSIRGRFDGHALASSWGGGVVRKKHKSRCLWAESRAGADYFIVLIGIAERGKKGSIFGALQDDNVAQILHNQLLLFSSSHVVQKSGPSKDHRALRPFR